MESHTIHSVKQFYYPDTDGELVEVQEDIITVGYNGVPQKTFVKGQLVPPAVYEYVTGKPFEVSVEQVEMPDEVENSEAVQVGQEQSQETEQPTDEISTEPEAAEVELENSTTDSTPETVVSTDTMPEVGDIAEEYPTESDSEVEVAEEIEKTTEETPTIPVISKPAIAKKPVGKKARRR